MTKSIFRQTDQEVEVEIVRATTVYKLLFFGLVWCLTPIGAVFGIAALFGADTVKWSATPIHGISGLLLGPIATAGVAIGFALFVGTMAWLGLWLQSQFRTMTIRFLPKVRIESHESGAADGATASDA